MEMKPLIKRILRESDWLDDLSNQFSGVDLPFEVAQNPRNRPKIANVFIVKTLWDYNDTYLREKFRFKSDDNTSFEWFMNVCKFYIKLLDDRDYTRWKDVNKIAKSIGLSMSSYDEDDNYGTPKDMSDYVFGQDYPAMLQEVEISYYDQGGVEYDVRLKEPD